MDTSITTFHQNLLMKWNCYNCPVCYYIKNPDLMNNSTCMKCNGDDSKICFCLMCGYVGCGRNEQGHALEHYQETNHQYVMELADFKVWDYKLAKFVHNLEDRDEKFENFHTYYNNNTFDSFCSCPICQHVQIPKLIRESVCMKCEDDVPGTLWICLICYHVGCSRQRSGHALEHFRKTKHQYSMQLNNFSIWDYNKHSYLHRVLRDNTGNNHAQETKQMDFEKRMDRLENEWTNVLRKLTNANERMITIEQRLMTLTNEKKVLERKLQEHDTKLNELITQFIGKKEDSLTSTPLINLNFRTTKNIEQPPLSLQPQSIVINKYSNQCPNESNDISENIEHSQFISVIILTLFLYHFVTLFLQIISENIMKLI